MSTSLRIFDSRQKLLGWRYAPNRLALPQNAAVDELAFEEKHMMKQICVLLVNCVLMGSAATQSVAQDLRPDRENFPQRRADYSPYVDDHFPNRVLFGDTHLHTSYSTDAGMMGTTVGPEEAYRVCRGEEIVSNSGLRVKLIRPLDFVVIADHAENLGLADFIERSDPILLANDKGKQWHDMVKAGKGYDAFLEWAFGGTEDLIKEPRMVRRAWDRVLENAEKYNQPGTFTALIGYEWSGMPDGNNIHRNVIFRDGPNRAGHVVPFSQYDSTNPEDLWEYMAAYEQRTGGRVLAIPHNGNLSNGIMFDDVTFTGKKLTKAWAETRARFEPVIEVVQQKGDAESHPKLSPDDEFADFETMDKGNLAGTAAKTDEMLPKEYARATLKRGLAFEERLGANPYKFGMVGSTDNHTGIPTTREENNFSKASFLEPSPTRYEHALIKAKVPELSIMETDVGAAGLAAVWARENTRESIWDALARKEVYATTGTRIQVRVFAGWTFEESDIHRPDFARAGYRGGVPMGGDLTAAPAGGAPRFMVRAIRDPDWANLDRIQVIKGWLDSTGKLHERVYDVAVSDGRTIGEDGRCREPVGNTVDEADASFSNSIGDALLAGYWVDPDFDPAERAFYYVRVLEIPTPRWTAYDAKFFKLKMTSGVRMHLQDRAHTSPIWYNP